MAEPKVAFLDTNIYLHYQQFEQVNWLDVLKTEAVRIVVPPVTMRELNKIKDTSPQPQIRKRAGATLKRLAALFANSTTDIVPLRDGVEIHLHPYEPMIDFSVHHLSRDVQDDQLMASILDYQKDNAVVETLLITSDAGLLLIAKAKHQGIRAWPCPENLKLPDLPDPEQIRTRELEAELNRLKNRLPRLGLEFDGGTIKTEFTLTLVDGILQADIQQKIEEVKEQHPKRNVSSSQQPRDYIGGGSLSQILAAAQNPLNTISQEDIEEYNGALDKFYERYAEYLKEQNTYEIVQGRLVRLDLQLVNSGTAPAEDIDIFMHFPDGFTLLSGRKLIKPPKKPHPPSAPKSTMQRMMEGMHSSMPDYRYLSPHIPSAESYSNVSAPHIKRTNSYDVTVHVDKIKHQLPEALEPLFVVFDDFETASSFHIDYELFSDDLPEKVTGQLHVIIRK